MKTIGLLILFSGYLTGCAMSAPKEDTHDIFVLVKQRNFDGAKKKVQDNSKGLMGTFATYSGGALDPANQGHSSDNISDLIDGAQYTLNFCDKKVSELKAFHGNDMNADQDRQSSFNQEITTAQEGFEQECIKKPLEDWSFIQKIKRYAAVDLYPLLMADKNQFNKELSRINSEINTRNKELAKADADAKVAEEKYEQSPEFYSKKLCEMSAIINAAKTNIAEENEAAKSSGFVDKKKMYENGRAIQINTGWIKKYSAEYRQKFGKNWSPSSCK